LFLIAKYIFLIYINGNKKALFCLFWRNTNMLFNFKKITMLFTSIAMVGGLAVSIGVNQKSAINTTAEAQWIQPGQIFYFTPNSNWKQDSARFAACLYEDGVGERGWVSLSAVSGKTDLYTMTYPEWSWSNRIIFVRMDPASNGVNSWDWDWNQTANLEYDGVKQYFTIPGSDWSGSDNTNWTNLYATESINFASSFSTTIGGVCDPTGASNNVTNELWNGQISAYNALEAGSKTYLSSGSESQIVNATALHDYIVAKYSRTPIF